MGPIGWTIIVLATGLVTASLAAASWFVPALLQARRPGWLEEGLELAKRAQLGDAFGLAAALFSAMAILGVVIAIVIQSNELKQQAFEVKQTVLALRDQRSAMARQEVEHHFFQLLGALRQVVADTTFIGIAGARADGRAAFAAMLESLKAGSNAAPSGRAQQTPVPAADYSRLQQVSRDYRAWYDKQASDQLGHYFRLLYHTVLYVHDQRLTHLERQHYTRLVRAHLSDPELVLLCYNGLTPGLGFEGFYPLIERYHLLANVSPQDLLFTTDVYFYPRNRKAIDRTASTSLDELRTMFGEANLEHVKQTWQLNYTS
jgi:hypothetical protein